jgi:hypothetical protein
MERRRGGNVAGYFSVRPGLKELYYKASSSYVVFWWTPGRH